MLKPVLFLLQIGGVLLRCLALVLPVTAAAQTDATVFWYLEREAGTESYEIRYLVTDDFLRSDEGDDDGGFVLFDRKRKMIYNVVPENRSILEIDGNGDMPEPDAALSIDVEQKDEPGAPPMGGNAALQLRLQANAALCATAVVVPGFLDAQRAVFEEFALALAVQQLRTLDNTPAQYRTPCFLASYIYANGYHLTRGLPLLEFSPGGDRRELLRYESGVSVDDALFVLPEGYRSFRITPQDE